MGRHHPDNLCLNNVICNPVYNAKHHWSNKFCYLTRVLTRQVIGSLVLSYREDFKKQTSQDINYL